MTYTGSKTTTSDRLSSVLFNTQIISNFLKTKLLQHQTLFSFNGYTLTCIEKKHEFITEENEYINTENEYINKENPSCFNNYIKQKLRRK